jgi:hypothetical protein
LYERTFFNKHSLILWRLPSVSSHSARFLTSFGMTWQLGGYVGEEVAIRSSNLHFEKNICESPLLHPKNSSKELSFL